MGLAETEREVPHCGILGIVAICKGGTNRAALTSLSYSNPSTPGASRGSCERNEGSGWKMSFYKALPAPMLSKVFKELHPFQPSLSLYVSHQGTAGDLGVPGRKFYVLVSIGYWQWASLSPSWCVLFLVSVAT